MKSMKSILLPLCLIALLSGLFFSQSPAAAQDETPSPSPSLPPSATREEYGRPLVIIQSYSLDTGSVTAGSDSNLTINLYNSGQHYAYNVVLTFTPGDLQPRSTGGVIVVGDIAPGNHASVSQPLTAVSDLWGKSLAELALNIAYTDQNGLGYSTNFNLTFSINQPKYTYYTPTPTPTITPTPTNAPIPRGQLVITTYRSDVNPLEPGTQFNLQLDVENLGSGEARRVTMIVGGGSTTSSSGTQEAGQTGGISGSSGDFTNFAPLGTSNVQSLGIIPVGGKITASQSLIVNVATNPGAYPLRITFIYLDERGNQVSDDQVITLLVYRLPKMDINFYQDPGMLYTNQPGALPLQIVNLGKTTAVMGNMTVESNGGQVMNNTILVGSLDPGGYFTLDSTVIPNQSGPLEIIVRVAYTDDFNQPQEIVKTLALEVLEAAPLEPTPGEGEMGGGEIVNPTPAFEETFTQKAWRFFLGLIGLDSALPANDGDAPLPIPDSGESAPNSSEIVPPLKGP